MSEICKKRVHRNERTTLPWAFKYYVYDSNVKYCDLKDFLKAQFVIFRCQKYVKKRVHGNEWTTLPWALRKCPRSLYFTPLALTLIDTNNKTSIQ